MSKVTRGGVLKEEDKTNPTSKYNTYGVLYNWPAAMEACPPGTHLPTDEEWHRLESFFTGEGSCVGGRVDKWDCDPAGTALKSTIGWSGTGDNLSGFAALPGGYRYSTGGFDGLGSTAYFWSSSEYETTHAWYRSLSSSQTDVLRLRYGRAYGFSVRCVQ